MDISELCGKVMLAVRVDTEEEQIEFIEATGLKFVMYHSQD